MNSEIFKFLTNTSNVSADSIMTINYEDNELKLTASFVRMILLHGIEFASDYYDDIMSLSSDSSSNDNDWTDT